MNPIFNDDSPLNFPTTFLEEIEINNRQKDEKAPIALVFQAPYDTNGIMSNACTQSLLLQIARTHRLVLKTLSETSSLQRKIQDASIKEKNEIDLLMILAHGQPNCMQLKKDLFCNGSDFHLEDFLFLNPKSKIVLYSCNTGQGLAQKIADITKRTVLAPMNALYDSTTCIDLKNREFKILSYDEKEEQHICAFRYNQIAESLTPKHLSSIVNNSSFCQMADYLKKTAELGDADAACKLALFYENGRGGLEKSDEKAFFWFGYAAHQNIALAQLNLGYFYSSGRGGLELSDEKATYWFSKAAEQGMAWAQYNLALFYLNARGGLEQSDEKAVQLFSLAAAQGLPEAIYNLGVLYEYGRGVTLSLNVAEQLYKIARNLGVVQAQERLKTLTRGLSPMDLLI